MILIKSSVVIKAKPIIQKCYFHTALAYFQTKYLRKSKISYSRKPQSRAGFGFFRRNFLRWFATRSRHKAKKRKMTRSKAGIKIKTVQKYLRTTSSFTRPSSTSNSPILAIKSQLQTLKGWLLLKLHFFFPTAFCAAFVTFA